METEQTGQPQHTMEINNFGGKPGIGMEDIVEKPLEVVNQLFEEFVKNRENSKAQWNPASALKNVIEEKWNKVPDEILKCSYCGYE